jgi:flagellin
MTVINTNTASINAQFNLNKVNKQMEAAMEQLSSGKRINTASDDAAGMAIASRITSEVKGIEMAIRNASDGQALIDTAEGAHVEIENMLQRARELAVQASNDTNSADDRASLQLEIDQLLTEIDRTAANTSWAGKTLMGGASGGASEFSFQIGTGGAASDTVSISIDEMSSKAIGIGTTGVSGGRATGDAGITFEDGRLTVLGVPEQGDAFTFTLNGTSISATYTTTDQYADDATGAAAQIEAAINTAVAASPTDFPGISVVNNNDGSLDITQSSVANIDTAVVTAGSGTASIDTDNNIVTFTYGAATDAFTLDVNGITVTVAARAVTDGYTADAAGTAAKFANLVQQTVGLENVTATDHGDGTVTITQSSAPVVEAAEVTLTSTSPLSVSYDDTNAISVAGAFVAGQTISFDLFGEEVSFVTASDDGFADTLAGVASQMAAAINEAGISGITAAKTSGANSVTLSADVNVSGAKVDSGDEFIVTTIGDSASAKIHITGDADDTVAMVAAGTNTAAAFADGDAYTFNVAGHEVKLVVDTSDGYLDTAVGVSQQMKDLIDDLGLEGLSVAVDTTATGNNAVGVTITRALTGTANSGSTVVTNVTSLAADEIGDPTFSGGIDVSTSAGAADALTRIDAALLTINTQRAELGAVSNRMEHTINNLSNVSSNLQSGLSRIQDADFAKVTGDLTKSQIMSQAATAMLAQANASKQGVLSLLQG